MISEKAPHKVSLLLGLACSNLKPRVFNGPKDFFLSAYEMYAGSWTQLGSTEIVVNDSAPKFSNPIKVEYYQGKHQQIVIEVFEVGKSRLKPILHGMFAVLPRPG